MSGCWLIRFRPGACVRWCARALLAGCLGVQGSAAWADPQDDKISRVKAAFVYNIAKFVQWPSAARPSTAHDSAAAPLAFCYYREDFIGRGFEAIDGKLLQGRSLARRVVEADEELANCHILLVAPAQLEHFSTAHGQHRLPVLTVADLTTAPEAQTLVPGVVINLVRQGSSIGFEVNLEQVASRGLILSSELLKLARNLSGRAAL